MLRGEDRVKNDPGPQEVRFSLNQENRYLSIPRRWDIKKRTWEQTSQEREDGLGDLGAKGADTQCPETLQKDICSGGGQLVRGKRTWVSLV